MKEVLRIGNAQAFWGDQPDAPARLLNQQPNLDFLTLDYLAEVSLSIMAIQREKDPHGGYAPDFVETVRTIAPLLEKNSKTRLVTNAGGLNPRGCGEACKRVLIENGHGHLKVAIVEGDDVLREIRQAPGNSVFNNLETGHSATAIANDLVTANAYLGAEPVANALNAGADIVITGRVADPSLTVGPCLAHFGWKRDDYDRIAGATVAGHLIECGTQATGGFSTDWLSLPNLENIGYPVVEMTEDGSFVLTKPPATGGRVDLRIAKEQLLYEIGDPGEYLSPDATVSFLNLSLRMDGEDRVHFSGAKGRKPPDTYKVSATYREGYQTSGMLTVFGLNSVEKARRCGEIVFQRMENAGIKPTKTNLECLGTGDSVLGAAGRPEKSNMLETVLRLSVSDPDRKIVERFSRELASLVTCGPQGVTGYATGRPKVRPVFGYWPCLIDRSSVQPSYYFLDD